MKYSEHFFFPLIIITWINNELLAVDSPCGEWEPYKEEKCFKIFDKYCLQNYVEAESICQQQQDNSNLIIIRFQEEQEFVSNFLKIKKASDNVWIGINSTNNKWIDGSDLVYNNWAQGNPKHKSDHCSQIQTDDDSFGKWSDVSCDKKNLVVCQKMQTWSLSHLQKILLNTIKNPYPVGFIYVQLPNEKAPTEIWPWMIWKDITSAYAGVFFRAMGGGAANFGQVQEENSSRLVHVNRVDWQGTCIEANVLANGQKTCIIDAEHTGNSDRGIQFTVSGGEVRPRNMAIRIWKRSG